MALQPTTHTATQPIEGTGARQLRTSAVSCRLDARHDWSLELCVLPHSDPSLAVIERFRAPGPALHRYAEVIRLLREEGWIVIDQGAALALHAAA